MNRIGIADWMRVNDLHARRDSEVRLAREIRESVGRMTGAYDAQWDKVETLTRAIAAAEREVVK